MSLSALFKTTLFLLFILQIYGESHGCRSALQRKRIRKVTLLPKAYSINVKLTVSLPGMYLLPENARLSFSSCSTCWPIRWHQCRRSPIGNRRANFIRKSIYFQFEWSIRAEFEGNSRTKLPIGEQSARMSSA